MKKFVINSVCIAVLCALGYVVKATYKATINEYRFGDEVFEAIEHSVANTGIENLILGDSVANQLFSRKYQLETTNFVYLASNQAITPIGNFALLKRYLVHNPQTKSVYYMALPQSLRNDGRADYTFHYMIYPFVETGAVDEFDDIELSHFQQRFSSSVFECKFIRRFIYADDNIYRIYHQWEKRHVPQASGKQIPALCERALLKMNSICKEHGAKFVLISSPVVDSSVENNQETVAHLIKLGKGEVAKHYLDSQIQVSEEQLSDHIHFKSEILAEQRTNIVSRIFQCINVVWP